jgi:hypothetical protein
MATIRLTMVAAVLALAASAAVSGQSRVDPAFKAAGVRCDQIAWSKESLAKHPRIAGACQEVTQRDGKYYVRFQAEVRGVADHGRWLTVKFKNGGRLTLTPPANMSVDIDGEATPVGRLRPGDQLNFYVPEDQLAASFFAGDPATATAQEVPISPAPPEPSARSMIGLAALILATLGGAPAMQSQGSH